ncbi:MAG: VWA domain-containing protein [Gammaproteobacteria bacterium]
MSVAEFHFLRPLWLLALPALAAMIWVFRGRAVQGTPWRRVVDAALLPHVLAQPGSAAARPLRRLRGLLIAAYVLAVLALAGPAWKRLPQPVFQDRSALVIMLDLSRSMEAQDLRPSRLARARYKVADLLAQRRTGMTALVVYAQDAYGVVPLTDDAATILSHLPVLEPGLMPAQGSRPERAVALALELLLQGGMPRGDLLLITDSLTAEQAEEVARELETHDHRLSILAMGTVAGAPIPRPGGGFFESEEGKPVVARLDPAPMQALVGRHGGRLLTAGSDDEDVRALVGLFATRIRTDTATRSDFTSGRWREEGPWLLLPLIPLAALLFRRGLIAAVLVTALPWSGKAEAWQWDDLWRRPDQQAAAALERGEDVRAAELFEDPRWSAAARYRAEDFAGAVETLQDLDGSDDHYNRGNGLVRQGRYKDAIAAYERALALDPGNDDARHNRDLVRQLLQQSASQGGGESGQQGEDRQSSRPQGGDGAQGEGRRGQGESERDGARGDPEMETGREEGGGESDRRLEELLAQRKREAGRDRLESDSGGQDGGEGDSQVPPPAEAGHDERREASQADEQWLRRIPDDPGGLLRRKFYYQYSQSNRTPSSDTPW